MYKSIIEADLKKVIKSLGYILPGDALLSIAQTSKFGDYTSNASLQLSKQKHKNSYQSPMEIANQILEQFGHPHYLERIEVAGPGFLNFYLKNEAIIKVLNEKVVAKTKDDYAKRYLIEYGHPNTHKEFHIGHLRTLTIGESIARLLQFHGHPVFRTDYGSDIGLPVAKALWGVQKVKSEKLKVQSEGSLKDKARFLGEAYALGHKAYEDEPQSKQEIDQMNIKIYQRDSEIVPLWEETKEWSLLYFQTLYTKLGVEFDARINESEVDQIGKQEVLDNVGKVFIEDQGAIIFPGEQYGLHNRVFVNSKGNPTYEGKELGLTRREEELFPFDVSLHIVDVQQSDFFKVVNKALELIDNRETKKRHIPYGFVSLTTGRMSSRMGNVISADDLIAEVTQEIKKQYPKGEISEDSYEKIAIGATKFYYLKYGLTSDIVFDIEKSVSLQGDSGPYVMYVYARINSLLNRAKKNEPKKDIKEDQEGVIAQGGKGTVDRVQVTVKNTGEGLEQEERELLRILEYFEVVIEKAYKNFQPNEITTYLLEVARRFNHFYESSPILISNKQEFRIKLAIKTAETIKLGLYLLGIETVEKM